LALYCLYIQHKEFEMPANQVCQICCTADFIELSAQSAPPSSLPLRLLACRDCGLVHFWPEAASSRMPAEGTRRTMNLGSYGMTLPVGS
jgi:hypothetical protein